jgi:hypothetical protein
MTPSVATPGHCRPDAPSPKWRSGLLSDDLTSEVEPESASVRRDARVPFTAAFSLAVSLIPERFIHYRVARSDVLLFLKRSWSGWFHSGVGCVTSLRGPLAEARSA